MLLGIPLISTPTSELELELREELLKDTPSSLLTPTVVKGSRRTTGVTPPVITTPKGPVRGSRQVIVEKKVDRLPEFELISRRVLGIEADDDESGTASQYELGVQRL